MSVTDVNKITGDLNQLNLNLKIHDKIWEHICKELNIINKLNGVEITGKQIRECKKTWKGKSSQFEPRLLCKIDQIRLLPYCFKKNNISILSIKNGTYLLTTGNIYIQIPQYQSVSKRIINNCDSIILDYGNSEATVLDLLLHNGIFEEILQEKINYGPLWGGRHRCHFDMILNNIEIKVDGSQFETDGCYESKNKICVVEAKTGKLNSFNIRQVYYPYRELHKKVRNRKEIITLFIHKYENIIKIYELKWDNYRIMDSVKIINYYQYIDISNCLK